MSNILIIGCGHMGSALLDLWSKEKEYKFTVIDPVRYKIINKTYKNKKILSFVSINKVKKINKFDIVLLAVKPQVIEKALKDYKFFSFKKNCLLISIIAGKKIVSLKRLLPNIHQIARVMPNMPALIGEGASCLVTNYNTSIINRKKVKKLFSKVGLTVWLKNEKEIDIATAISGSGPGFVFYLVDAMEKAANKLGLNEKINKRLILQTFLGSLKLLKNQNISAGELVKNIAIKGGTTEAGIKVMKKNNINKIFSNILSSAYKKANLIGRK